MSETPKRHEVHLHKLLLGSLCKALVTVTGVHREETGKTVEEFISVLVPNVLTLSLGDDWDAWVKENIYSDIVNTGGRVSVGNDTTTHGAHADSQHNGIPVYKLYYLLESGGATTVFFREHGHPIERVGTTENICHCDDYSKLEVLDKVQFPVGQWVLLNTNILHGVEDVTGDRINLAVMLATNDIVSVIQQLI